MKKLNKKGFTLIELIVVIAILAILAAILIPSVTGYITKATDSKNAANCRSLYAQTAMEVMIGTTPTKGTITGTAPNMSGSYSTTDLTIAFTYDSADAVVKTYTCVTKTGTSKTINPVSN